MGASIYDVHKICRFFPPSPNCPHYHATFLYYPSLLCLLFQCGHPTWKLPIPRGGISDKKCLVGNLHIPQSELRHHGWCPCVLRALSWQDLNAVSHRLPTYVPSPSQRCLSVPRRIPRRTAGVNGEKVGWKTSLKRKSRNYLELVARVICQYHS